MKHRNRRPNSDNNTNINVKVDQFYESAFRRVCTVKNAFEAPE